MTIREVAARAGVSKSTAAYALRGDPRICAETAAKIREVARALGYIRSPLVQSLMGQVRSGRVHARIVNLGYVLSGSASHPENCWKSEALLFRGAMKRAGELGYSLDILHVDAPGMTWPRLLNVARSRGIRGLLLGPMTSHGSRLDVDFSDFAVVADGYTLESPEFDRVASDLSNGILKALEALRNRGFKKIGVAFGNLSLQRVRFSFATGAWVFKKLHPDLLLDILELPTGRDAGKTLARWIRLHRPDVMLTTPDLPRAAYAPGGLRMPTGLQWFVTEPPLDPCLGFLEQRHEAIGELAIETLSSKVERGVRGIPPIPHLLLIEPELQFPGTSGLL